MSDPKSKAERLKAAREEFDRIADAAREDYVRVVRQAQAECERAVRAIEREPDPMSPDPATKAERLKAAREEFTEAYRAFSEALREFKTADERYWVASRALTIKCLEIEQESEP